MRVPKNLGKVLLCLAISLGNFLPFSVIISFITQLCEQLHLHNVGFYAMGASSVSIISFCLFAPAFVRLYGTKRAIIVSSFGIW